MANRTMTAGMQSGVDADAVVPALLSKFEFDSGDLRLWTGIGDITFNAEIYQGSGDLLNISEVEETTAIKAAGVSFTLSGVNAAILAIGLDEDIQERFCTVWFALINNSTKTVVSDPFAIFKGRMDTFELSEDGNTSLGILRVENRLADLARPSISRYTAEDQRSLFTEDSGLDFVIEVSKGKQLIWGLGN